MGKDRFKELLGILPEGWEAKAKELGALRRAREIKTPEELLRLILLYLTEGKSFAGTSAITRLSGEAEMSKVAVFKRIRNRVHTPVSDTTPLTSDPDASSAPG